jgi:hypothetical protein
MQYSVVPGEVVLFHLRARLVAETGGHVIVDHARRLHVCIDNRAADKPEATLLEILTQGVGFG